MSKGPVLPAAADFFRLRIHGHQPSAREGTDIRTTFFVQRQIPSRDTTAPVAQHLRVGSSPLDPVARVIGSRVVRTALRPVKLHLGKCLANPAHHLRCPHISVKRNRIAELAEIRILQFIDCPAPQVVVVIQNPDLRCHPALLQRGTEVVLHECDFVFLRP